MTAPPPRVVVVAAWDGPVVVRRLAADEPDPTAGELVAIARAFVDAGDWHLPGEVALSARVVESFVFPGRDGVATHARRRGAPGFL